MKALPNIKEGSARERFPREPDEKIVRGPKIIDINRLRIFGVDALQTGDCFPIITKQVWRTVTPALADFHG